MNRREFFKDATSLTVAGAMAVSAMELRAEEGAKDVAPADGDIPSGSPVNCAVIGANLRGREILSSLAKMGKTAPVISVCDTFTAPVFVKKSTSIVPSAQFVEDYRKVLDDKTVQAVFIATPSHKHKQIALDAIAAGKHVYCEAPLATDLDEAKAIAKAGMAAKTVFQPGLQQRCNMQNLHVYNFVRSGALGTLVSGRAQWHNRQSWRQVWPTDERMNDLNWRLSKATSSGILGEIGIHQVDTASWFIKSLPLSVIGFGGLLAWNDGRDIPDTVQCVLEYPGNINYLYDATIANGFDGYYEMFFGTSSAIQLRDQRAWMFKESDSNDLGWETFARKDDIDIGDPKAGTGIKTATGIALVADASKQLALGKQPGLVGTDVSKTSLYQAIDAFLTSIRKNTRPAVSAEEGYQATVIAHKCNEAILSKSKITFEKQWFEI